MIRQRIYVEWTYRYNRLVSRFRFDPIHFVRCWLWHFVAALLWIFHAKWRAEYATYVQRSNDLGYCSMSFSLWVPTKWRAWIVGFD